MTSSLSVLPELSSDLSLLRQLSLQGLLITYISTSLLHSRLSVETLSTDTTEHLLRLYEHENGIKTPDDQREFCSRHLLQPADLLFLATKPTKLKQHLKRIYYPSVPSRFLQLEQQLTKVTYSLLRTHDHLSAKALYLQIKDEEISFAEASRQHSIGAERFSNGLVGPVELARLHPQLASLIYTAQPGSLLPPQIIDQSCLIVRLESLIKPKLDDATYERVASIMLHEDISLEAQQYIQSLNLSE